MIAPLLTIGIPTYNRPESLGKILEILENEPRDLFTILISDDSTTDDVGEVVFRFQQSMSNIRYVRNTPSLGFNKNVATIYERAETRYVWFFCDDDRPYSGAVEKVVESLLTYSPSVALYNCDWHDSFHRESVAQASSNVFLTEVNTPSDYAIIMRATFLSILVVERRISLDNILRHPEVSENVFIQLTIVLQILTDKFKLVSIGEPVLYRDVGFNYGEFYKFNLIDPLRAIYFFPHKFDGNQFINFMRRQLPIFALLFLSQKLGLFHYRGTPRKQTILDIYRFYGWLSLPIHTFRLVFSLVPGGLVKVIYFLQLCIIHGGWRQGGLVYKMMVGRADRCLRETDFLNHR